MGFAGSDNFTRYTVSNTGIDTTVLDEQVNGFSSEASWAASTNQNARATRNLADGSALLDKMMILLQANSNTDDGAFVQSEVSTAAGVFSDGNQINTLDQATGIFINTTQTDTVVSDGSFCLNYQQFDNSINVRALAMRVTSS